MVVDRPAPQAVWPKTQDVMLWQSADAYYERPDTGAGYWRQGSVFPPTWQMQVDNIRLELRPAANGQIGIFPEQLANWRWLTQCLQQQKQSVRVLNAFAYTGAATLTASAAAETVEVCHVDGAKAAITAARHNAEISALQQRPIRWIVDDVMTFLKREVKRGSQYDGFILDPPAFGRGARGSWQLKRDLPGLLECVNQLLSPGPCFIILSCHAPELDAVELAAMLANTIDVGESKVEALDLVIPSVQGHDLPSSICARLQFS